MGLSTGKYICYCDGSVRNKTAYSSFVIKDDKGNYIDTKIIETKECNKVHFAETNAINELIKFFISCKCVNCTIFIYSDAKGTVDTINRQWKKDKEPYINVINNFNKLKSLNKVNLRWKSRKENKTADRIIKLPQALDGAEKFEINDKANETGKERSEVVQRINSMNIEKDKILDSSNIKNFEHVLGEIDNVLYYISDIDEYRNKLSYNECLYNQGLDDLDFLLNTKKVSASELSKIYKTRKEILNAKQDVSMELEYIDLIPDDIWGQLLSVMQLIKEEYVNHFNKKNADKIKLDYLSFFDNIKDIIEK